MLLFDVSRKAEYYAHRSFVSWLESYFFYKYICLRLYKNASIVSYSLVRYTKNFIKNMKNLALKIESNNIEFVKEIKVSEVHLQKKLNIAELQINCQCRMKILRALKS